MMEQRTCVILDAVITGGNSEKELLKEKQTEKGTIQINIWRGKRLSTPVFLPGESHGQRSLVGRSP